MGYIYVVLSSVLFGILPSLQNKAMLNGASALMVLFVGSFTCFIAFAFLCLLKKVDLRCSKRQVPFFLLSGITIFLTDLFLPEAYTYMPVGLVTSIHFTYPVIVTLANVLFFDQKFFKGMIIAIVFSLCGLTLLSGGVKSVDMRGFLFAVASAFSYAACLVISDRSNIAAEDPLKKNFYLFFFCTLLSILLYGKEIPSFGFQVDQLSYIVLAGLMLGAGSLLLTKGISLLGSFRASFISTLEPVTSMVFSMILYHYDLSLQSIIGFILILASMFFVIGEKE